jgi:hypothetical protein
MPEMTTISKHVENPALDQGELFQRGLDLVRRLAGRSWTDHNIHDPGITMLEILAYALTDLGNRASLAIEDLLTGETDDAPLRTQFFTAEDILPSSPLTELDYRKLLIDLPGIKNAWLVRGGPVLYADTHAGELRWTKTGEPNEVEVPLAGIHDVLLECLEHVSDPASVIVKARECLDANRNLCQDFENIRIVESQQFNLCCALDIAPTADQDAVAAEVMFRVGEYMAPSVPIYTLEEMQARTHADGRRYSTDEIFMGPLLQGGFIADEDLLAARLPSELRLSDIIHVIMNVPGVIALRDILINPSGASSGPKEPWILPVKPGHKPELNREQSRVTVYKDEMFVGLDKARVEQLTQDLRSEERAKDETQRRSVRSIPVGQPLRIAEYYSLQNHFPAVYGLSEEGLPQNASALRHVQADQLKGYLLFFDQLIADALAQLSRLRSLYSRDSDQRRARFHQVVDSFRDHARIYGVEDPRALLDDLDPPDSQAAARERFLDHLIARVAEDLSQFTAALRSAFPERETDVFLMKCEFLRDYAKLGRERGLAWNLSLRGYWRRGNRMTTSGFERRLARLLGLGNKESILVVESVLLRPRKADDPLLAIEPAPDCSDCSELDPYSRRLHVLLPAHGVRSNSMEFRRYVEETIHVECPAHLLPRISWLSDADMARVETIYREWLQVDADSRIDERANKLRELSDLLVEVRNAYPTGRLLDCSSDGGQPRFVLGRTILGPPAAPPNPGVSS